MSQSAGRVDRGDGGARPRLLLLFAPADHLHRDPACATLAWLAEAGGLLFESYFDSEHSGVHFGGGHPAWAPTADLMGPTVVGARHLEALWLLSQRFSCEAVCLGASSYEPWLRTLGIPVHSRSGDIATFYSEVFSAYQIPLPPEPLVVGDGDRPQGIPLTAYAFPEVFGRRRLAIADGDASALAALAPGRSIGTLWVTPGRRQQLEVQGYGVAELGPATGGLTVADHTAWMAERWGDGEHSFILGDPQLVGRWAPTAIRHRWLPLYGVPQVDVISRMATAISRQPLVHGRQHHDADFFRLSELGTAFQVLDPGSPPFPVISEVSPTRCRSGPADPARPPTDSRRTLGEATDDQPSDGRPTDDQLRAWAREGRVLSTLLFWTGMIRELQNLFPLGDLLSLTRLRCGLVLTTESFRYGEGTPLWLLGVPERAGGLFPSVEPLLTDTGSGVIVASHAPPDRFADSLKASLAQFEDEVGDSRLVPRGWWAHLDAPLIRRRPPRVSRFADRPRIRVRYTPRQLELAEPPAPGGPRRSTFRDLVRQSPASRYFAPWRPYESFRPGHASRTVLEAVESAGFDYAITKAAFGPVPRVAAGFERLVVFNHTSGRWDGWSPFLTVNSLQDLRRAERKLLRRRGPGWLVGALDTCLWTFTGPVWSRGTELHALCSWMAHGGTSGKIINATPSTVARYARLLAEMGKVEEIPTG